MFSRDKVRILMFGRITYDKYFNVWKDGINIQMFARRTVEFECLEG